MPKTKKTRNLAEYGRTRRYELRNAVKWKGKPINEQRAIDLQLDNLNEPDVAEDEENDLCQNERAPNNILGNNKNTLETESSDEDDDYNSVASDEGSDLIKDVDQNYDDDDDDDDDREAGNGESDVDSNYHEEDNVYEYENVCEFVSDNEAVNVDNDDADGDQNEVDFDDNIDDDADEAADGDDGNSYIYDGADMTVQEGMIAVLTFVLKFNLSGTCLSALLELLSLLLPNTSRLKKTKYKFQKYFGDIKSSIVRHHFCSRCFSLLRNNLPCSCRDSPIKDESFFLELPIVEQLNNLLNKKGIIEQLQANFGREKNDLIGDITDGKVYEEARMKTGLLNEEFDISFTFYSDGAPAFKSSNMKIWPLYMMINELPYKKRILKENIVVPAIWCGQKNPLVNLFLQPLYEELTTLQEGVEIRINDLNRNIKVRAIVINATFDIPAKADFMNHVHHNGEFGCTYCLSSGKSVEGPDFGRTHVYPHEPVIQLRTSEEHSRHSEVAFEAGTSFYGVKGPSLLHSIMPCVIEGVGVDVMHCTYIGVAKKLANLWFGPGHRHEKFSLASKRDIVDSRLLKIKPISSISRLPRSLINHGAQWKASEWRNWFHYYSIPILSDLMDAQYFSHYLQLVIGVSILSCDSISEEKIFEAEQLLSSFVEQFAELYGERYMSINIHLLIHFADSVRNVGPLFVSSCFPLEDLNGKILKFIHGTNHVGLQISSYIAYSMMLPSAILSLDDDSLVKEFCMKYSTTGKRLTNTEKIFDKVYTLGKIKVYNAIPNYINNLLITSGININGLKISNFRGIKKDGYIIYGLDYIRPKKYASYAVLYNDDDDDEDETHVAAVKTFIKICRCNNKCDEDCDALFFAIIICGESYVTFKTILGKIDDKDRSFEELDTPLFYLRRFVLDKSKTKLISIEKIQQVCYTIRVGENVYIGDLINNTDHSAD